MVFCHNVSVIIPSCLTLILTFVGNRLHVSATDRVSNAVVEFDFPRAECIARQFEDTVSSSYIGDLRRNVTTTSCLDGIGIRGNSSDDTPNPRLQSTATVSNLIPLIGAFGVTWVADASCLLDFVPGSRR